MAKFVAEGEFRPQLSIFTSSGLFELDASNREEHEVYLRKPDGQVVALAPFEYSTLLVLASRPGEFIPRQSMIASLGLTPMYGGLSKRILELRRILGENAIETHGHHGYRLVLGEKGE